MSGSVSLAATINFGVRRLVLLILNLQRFLDFGRNNNFKAVPAVAGWPQSKSASAHLQLFSQNPMQPHEQCQRRHDQNYGVERKHAKLNSEITFLQSEEHVWLAAAAIIVLLH